MAALLVMLAVMAIMMTVAMPAWRQMVQREKEEELIFRGQQYVRAIGLFQRKYAASFPPSIDVLLSQRFLRKKYKDPMSADGEFQVLYQMSAQQPGQTGPGQMGPGQAGLGQTGLGQTGLGQTGQRQPSQSGATGTPGGRSGEGSQGGAAASGPAGSQNPGRQQPGASAFGFTGGTLGPRGGIIGVASKSTDTSVRLYNGRNHYNEWQFIFAPTMMPGQGQARPGMPGLGGRGMGPGGRGGAGRPGMNPGGPGGAGSPAPTSPGRPPGR